MDLIEVTEGKTTFFVPTQDAATQFPPGTAPIFFNRKMELNRDATILMVSVVKPSDYLDAMGATGARVSGWQMSVTFRSRLTTVIPRESP